MVKFNMTMRRVYMIFCDTSLTLPHDLYKQSLIICAQVPKVYDHLPLA